MTNILATARGKKIKLADGKEYTLSPYNMNMMADLEEEFDCNLDELGGKLKGRMFGTLRKLLWIFLRENHPDMTLRDAGKLVEMDQVAGILKEITSALSGLET